MPATAYQNKLYGDTLLGAGTPPMFYGGLIIATKWLPSTTYVAGKYVTGSAFGSTNTHVYICTTGGITGASEPAWVQTTGSVTISGSTQFTECSNLFQLGVFTDAEPSGFNYSRAPITNNKTYWPTPTGINPVTWKNGHDIAWPESSAAWGDIAGVFLSDASSAGNPRYWGTLNGGLLAVGSAHITPTFPATALIITQR